MGLETLPSPGVDLEVCLGARCFTLTQKFVYSLGWPCDGYTLPNHRSIAYPTFNGDAQSQNPSLIWQIREVYVECRFEFPPGLLSSQPHADSFRSTRLTYIPLPW